MRLTLFDTFAAPGTLLVLFMLSQIRRRAEPAHGRSTGLCDLLKDRLTREQFFRLCTMIVSRLTWAFLLLLLAIVGWMLFAAT